MNDYLQSIDLSLDKLMSGTPTPFDDNNSTNENYFGSYQSPHHQNANLPRSDPTMGYGLWYPDTTTSATTTTTTNSMTSSSSPANHTQLNGHLQGPIEFQSGTYSDSFYDFNDPPHHPPHSNDMYQYTNDYSLHNNLWDSFASPAENYNYNTTNPPNTSSTTATATGAGAGAGTAVNMNTTATPTPSQTGYTATPVSQTYSPSISYDLEYGDDADYGRLADYSNDHSPALSNDFFANNHISTSTSGAGAGFAAPLATDDIGSNATSPKAARNKVDKKPKKSSSSSSSRRTSSSVSSSSVSEDKKYQCPICHRTFKRDLPRHLRTHEVNARFSCPFPRSHCSHKRGQFNRPYDFKKHLLHSHFIFDDPSARGFKDLQSKLEALGQCTCGQRFKADDWIQNHILVADDTIRCANLNSLVNMSLSTSASVSPESS